jgi:hypothetical protein
MIMLNYWKFLISWKRKYISNLVLFSSRLVVKLMHTLKYSCWIFRVGNFMLEASVRSFIVFFYPNIAKMFPNWSGWNFLKGTFKPRQKLFQDTIDEHSRTLPDGHPRDFIDA